MYTRLFSHFRGLKIVVVMFLFAFFLFVLVGSGFAEPEVIFVGDIPIVESEHPYPNNSNQVWLVYNDTGASAAAVHFSRIDIEDNVDRIELLDENDVIVQRIDTSRNNIMSAPVPGSVIKIRLVSDSSDPAWGFVVDRIEAVNYPSIAYSSHPYENNLDEEYWVFNPDGTAAASRVVFSSLFLEENVDFLILSDAAGNNYQWITGRHPTGIISKAIPGDAVQIRFVTDKSVTAWGFNVSNVETAAAPDTPDSRPDYGEALAESTHPHPYDCGAPTHLYTIVNPDPNAVNSKIHFERIEMGAGDSLQIFTEEDILIERIGGSRENYWTDYVPGRVVKILMSCGDFYRGWGFLADDIVTAGPKEVLAQSSHNYGSTTEWTVINKDSNAYSTKVHFERLQLSSGDNVRIYDEERTLIQVFGQYTNLTNYWSDYVPGRIVYIELSTSDYYYDWGVRINDVATSQEGPVLAQSSHPYAGDKSWTIINPNLQATETRIHFSRLSISSGDRLHILDENNNVMQTFAAYTNERNVWSAPVPGRVVNLQLYTSDAYTDWGFHVDNIAPQSSEPIPSAFISSVYVNLLYP
ncbi:MAG: hypothetical protein WAS33_04800, partial [Candidatus Promineifilaceae bacterium]